MSESTHIQLLCIAKRENDAATIQGFLRDRGQPVRMQWIQANDTLEEVLKQHPSDMIYISAENDKLLEYSLHCARKVQPQTPVLLLVQEIEPNSAEQALQLRARDAVSVQHLEHLLAVTLRELVAAKLESNYQEAKRELNLLRQRLASLVNASGLAIARIEEGILVEASQDFCTLFGLEEGQAAIGRPVLEFIQDKEQARIKKLINRCVQGKGDTEDLDTTGLTQDGQAFPLRISLTCIEGEDGSSAELQARRMDQRRSDRRGEAPKPTVDTTKEAEADSKAAVIDDKTMHEIDVALKNDRYRMEIRPMVSLDGQDCNIIDCELRLQNAAGKWFEATAESQATGTTLQAVDMRLLTNATEFMALRAAKSEETTIIAPIHPASIGQLNTLKAWAKSDLKGLLKDNQHLVLSLAEKAFAKDTAPTQRLVEELRDAGIKFALDQARGGDITVSLIDALHPEFLCLDRAATQLLISQGNDHAQLAKATAHGHEHGMKIVAFPLPDAHSMAMLWQRGVNLLRGSQFEVPN
ncbi:MAG: EAL domain-containing protein [Salinisphaeraceae bacterium]|nr:EAL domain-containing protein [Salinisphaeraceae bacterium]